MCRFVSAVVTKDGDFLLGITSNSHSDILTEAGLVDDHRNIVRLEYTPNLGALESWQASGKLDPDEWFFRVDQDMIPDWFNAGQVKERFWRTIEAHTFWCAPGSQTERRNAPPRTRVLLMHGWELREVPVGNVIVRATGVDVLLMRGAIGKMDGNSVIHSLCPEGRVESMELGSRVFDCLGTIGNLRGAVNALHGCGTVECARSSAHIGMAVGQSRIGLLDRGASVDQISGAASIHSCRGNVRLISGEAYVKAYLGAELGEVRGEARVCFASDVPLAEVRALNIKGDYVTVSSKCGMTKGRRDKAEEAASGLRDLLRWLHDDVRGVCEPPVEAAEVITNAINLIV